MTATTLPQLVGRHGERAALDRLASSLQSGRPGVCVIRGEAGVGKTILLEYVTTRARRDVRVVRVQGIEADMELAWASLHQLCTPFLASARALPAPQRDALLVAFGMTAGDPPDGYMVGLAALTLLTLAAEARPVLVVVDDAQWLDHASLQALEFVARRLVAEPIAIVVTTLQPDGEEVLYGLPQLRVTGLDDNDAGMLLESSVDGRLDPRVRDRIVAETRGNPLALTELARGRSASELAYGLEQPGTDSVAGGVVEDYLRRVAALPPQARTLLLLAAAEPVGDPDVLLRAANHLGIAYEESGADTDGLIDLGEVVRFRHSLARSAVYRAASLAERRAAHSTLAAATDPVLDPDRRAWHAALACPGPDEEVAAELERAADRARQRGGIAAEAVMQERAAALTPDPRQRGRRALAAAEAHLSAAAPARAKEIAAIADLCPLAPVDRARADRLRARMLFAANRRDEAAQLLLDAANRFAAEGSVLAREAYLEAISATVFAGRIDGAYGARAVAIASRASGAPPSASAASDLLLEGAVMLLAEGPEKGIPALSRALEPLMNEDINSRDEAMRWLITSPIALESFIHQGWNMRAADALSARAVRIARDIGALGMLPPALTLSAGVQIHYGDFDAAKRAIEEADAIAAATGQARHRYAALILAAWRGDRETAQEIITQAESTAVERDETSILGLTAYAQSILCNGLGRYREASLAARAGIGRDGYTFTGRLLAEQVDAAVRCGLFAEAKMSCDRLAELAGAADTGWSRGVLARSRAWLTEDGAEAQWLFQTAIDELNHDGVTVEVARTHLVYGEWLRRQRRRADAREHLRRAHGMFDAMGALSFAESARRELRAAGERAPSRERISAPLLTPQEAQVASLAVAGLTNPLIAAELFLSPHTVEWHLRNIYRKLDINSRRHLSSALEAAAGRSGGSSD